MSKTCYVIANWKMNPASKTEALALVGQLKKSLPRTKIVQSVIVPPALFLLSLKEKFSGIAYGVQTVAPDETHAHTGSISARMAKNSGAKFAVIGHSEVRSGGASNEAVGDMLREALKAGLVPVLCVGEKSRDHNGFYLHEIQTQIEDALSRVPKASHKDIVIAYEPVWAIGKDALREATPEEFLEISIFIRKVCADSMGHKVAADVVILYGGSVDEKNAQAFLQAGAQGFLVGRASLDAKKFVAIVSLTEEFYKNKK